MRFLKIACLLSVILFSQMSYAVDPRGEKAYDAGLVAYNNREYQKAVYAFENSMNFNPNLYKSYCMLGLAYIQNDEPLKAQNVLTQAVRDFPNEWKAYILLAEYYDTQGDYHQSVSYYQQAMALPTFPEKEKRKYSQKLTTAEANRRAKWSVSESEREEILASIDTPLDMTKFRASVVERQENGAFHIVYSLKTDDYRNDNWKEVLDLTCTEPLIDKNGAYFRLNDYLAKSYRESDADMDTIERGDNTRLFEVLLRKPTTKIIGYIYPVRDRYCVAQYMNRSRLSLKEEQMWQAHVRHIRIRRF